MVEHIRSAEQQKAEEAAKQADAHRATIDAMKDSQFQELSSSVRALEKIGYGIGGLGALLLTVLGLVYFGPLTTVQNAASELKGEVKGLASQNTAITHQVTEIKTDLNKLKDSTDKATIGLAAIQNTPIEIAKANESIQKAAIDIAGLKNLTTEVGELKKTVAATNEAMTALAQAHAKHDQKMTSLISSVDDLAKANDSRKLVKKLQLIACSVPLNYDATAKQINGGVEFVFECNDTAPYLKNLIADRSVAAVEASIEFDKAADSANARRIDTVVNAEIQESGVALLRVWTKDSERFTAEKTARGLTAKLLVTLAFP